MPSPINAATVIMYVGQYLSQRASETERCKFSVYVTNSGTRSVYQPSTTLPDFKRELILLSTPDLQALIVAAKFPEKLSADGKKTTGHHRVIKGFGRIFQVFRQQWQTFIIHLPIKCTTGTLILSPVKNIINIIFNKLNLVL